jgi:hypothetical protein
MKNILAKRILWRALAPPQLLETQQHRQHPFKFAVEMDLVSAEAIQLVGVESLTKCVLPNERPVRQFLLAVFEPWQHLAFEEAPQSLVISSRDFFTLTSAAGQITSSYVSAAGNTSGTLFVSSGGHLVAAIKMVGAYSAGDFHITSGIGDTVAITDPTVPNGAALRQGRRKTRRYFNGR